MVYLFEKRIATEIVAKIKNVVNIGKGVELTFGMVPHAVSVMFRIAVVGNHKSSVSRVSFLHNALSLPHEPRYLLKLSLTVQFCFIHADIASASFGSGASQSPPDPNPPPAVATALIIQLRWI